MMNKSDIDHALHQIEQMVRIARRSTDNLKPSKDIAYRLLPVDQQESLDFALGDILDKVTALKEDWDYTEPPAAAAPASESDDAESGTTDKPDLGWRSAYSGLEGAICDATHMIDIATEMANDEQDIDEQFLFAIIHSQELMRRLKARFYKDWGEAVG
jgi:tRNA A37 threonylcarbamoyltransferase TsaD